MKLIYILDYVFSFREGSKNNPDLHVSKSKLEAVSKKTHKLLRSTNTLIGIRVLITLAVSWLYLIWAKVDTKTDDNFFILL